MLHPLINNFFILLTYSKILIITLLISLLTLFKLVL